MLIKMRGYRFKKLLLALSLVLGLAGTTSAAEFWLKAEAFSKTMPGGVVVTMWGFSQCTDATYTTCGAPSSPGPTLVVPDNDPSLTINLRNNLTGLYTEPVSMMIPGQAPATMVPVRNADGRVRSFTNEAAVGTTAQYIWPVFRPGTFLYQSATHPGLQIPMGLSGVVKKDAAPGAVYTGPERRLRQPRITTRASSLSTVRLTLLAEALYLPGRSAR
jgi:FtsP/CotA-like multicopper oxidase with cupredoxin domain